MDGLSPLAPVCFKAEAEYSVFFRDAFSLLDKKGFGWVEAGKVAEILDELRVLNNSSGIIELMIREFGVDADGHILYDTFVDLLMSTTNSYAPEQPKPGAL